MLNDGLDPDQRIRILPQPKRKKTGLWLALGLVCAIIVTGGAGGAWFMFGRSTAIPIDTETEAQIDASQPCDTKVSHFAADPEIVVIDFPNLTIQGLTLDRVAALIEKAHLPRNQVLDDVDLREAIYDCGDTIESYYYGHDYKAADLARFFQLAAQQNITLNAHELWLKQLLNQLGWLDPGAVGALITLPAAVPPVTESMRAVILHHEISHGAFYTVPAYEAYAESFWNSLTDVDRAAFISFLSTEGYDTNNTNLMLNEAQAYLVFTPDPQFFSAKALGMSQAQLDTLREGYIAGMPSFWLTPLANETLPVSAPLKACQTN
ncbi:MAG: hypothetical protein B7Y73_00885 [Acidocella sp. 35-58-6]|nr:MAG: hypothetical protein B7Y73_00885 [Acidocella sp. 35-58-6]